MNGNICAPAEQSDYPKWFLSVPSEPVTLVSVDRDDVWEALDRQLGREPTEAEFALCWDDINSKKDFVDWDQLEMDMCSSLNCPKCLNMHVPGDCAHTVEVPDR